MPSMSMIRLPQISDEKEFENVLMDYGQTVYKGIATVYGRSGQVQYGIDVVVEKENGDRVCIQCKNYRDTKVTVDKIDNWIEEAEKSSVLFEHFVIAVACRRDIKLQNHVFKVCDERKRAGLFTVSIIFWDDIEHYIKKDLNLLRMYYPEFFYKEYCFADAYNKVNGPIQDKKYNENSSIGKSHIINADDKSIELKDMDYLCMLEEKKLIPIGSIFELKKEYLDIIVHHKISEFLRADITVGFAFDLAIECDVFEVELQDLIDRAIIFKGNDLYELICKFQNIFSLYIEYLTTISQSDGVIIRFASLRYEGAAMNEKNEIEEADRLRRMTWELLEEIAEWH